MRARALVAAVVVASLVVFVAPVRAETQSFTANLSAEEEVPVAGPPGATGTAKITVDIAQEQLCYELSWSEMEDPNEGHVHKGPQGAPGPALIPLDPAANGPKACISVAGVLLQDLVLDPGGHYVNLHTPDFPFGAVRGQLSPA